MEKIEVESKIQQKGYVYIKDNKGNEYKETTTDIVDYMDMYYESNEGECSFIDFLSNYLTWKYITLPQLKQGLVNGN